jgi:uncharacterized protein (DUF1501 family)
MPITRRAFVRNGALALVGTSALPVFLKRAIAVAGPAARDKRLVVIFQRGAADGLNMVVPHAEPAYYSMRPTINIPRHAVLDLDGFFGLHPALTPLQPLWKQRHLAIVHAAGSPDATRSHFDAQDYMESGTPGFKTTEEGWLNRALHAVPAPNGSSGFRAIALGHALPRILAGPEPAVAANNINDLRVGGRNSKTAPGADYPRGYFGDSLRRLAQMIKANSSVQVAFADIGGWDHHANQGGTQGQLANLLREFSGALAAFWTDLGDLAEDTIVITMSEFGRTARENSNRGTDHGHANVMLVMGGRVKGGKVYGRWPGLETSQLHEGRDLAVTTDFRRVLGEAVAQHLGNGQLDSVFPEFDNSPAKFLGFLG